MIFLERFITRRKKDPKRNKPIFYKSQTFAIIFSIYNNTIFIRESKFNSKTELSI